jgi:hypothetical protein
VAPEVALPAYALFDLAILAGLGAGPATLLSRRGGEHFVLAPAIGFAVAASILTTAAVLMPLHIAAFAVLLPLMLLSVAWALRAYRKREEHGQARRLIPPVALGLVGLGVALIPGIVRGTLGPISLFIFDGWGYIQTDLWLQGHKAGAVPPCCVPNPDLSLFTGSGFSSGGQRIGVSAVNGSLTTLLGTTPDRTHLAFLAALVGMVPLTVWWVARRLGASGLGAAVGACFGLSPAVLMFVADSTLANLSGIVLAPPALFLGAVALRGGERSTAALAAVFLAGLISAYPEFLAPTVVAGLLGGLVAAVATGRGVTARVRMLVTQIGVAVAVLGLLAPAGIARAAKYLASRQEDGPWAVGLPPRWLTGESGGAWSFGVVHLYELQRWVLFDGLRRAIAVVLPLALVTVLVVGLFRAGWRRTLFIAAPVGAAVALGLWAYTTYQGGRCEYCLWKALTYMLPFIAVGLGVATTRLLPARSAVPPKAFTRGAVALVVAIGIAAIGRSDAKLTRALIESPAVVRTSLREVGAAVAHLPAGARILLEGADASAAEKYSVPAFYYLARGEGHQVRFDASGPGTQYLMSPSPPEAYYAPDYDYVLTAFPGVATGRTAIQVEGPYALSRRAPLDVSIVRTGYAQDPSESSRAIPWVTGPFELWGTSPREMTAPLRIGLRRPAGSTATLDLATADGRQLAVAPLAGDVLCVTVPLREGRTVLRADPVLPTPPVPVVRPTESDPVPPPSKDLGIASLAVGGDPCPPKTAGGPLRGRLVP